MKEEITVRVPEERVAEFYQMFGKWLASSPCPPEVQPPAPEPQKNLPWADDDTDKARTVFLQLSLEARLLFQHLIDHPDEWFSALDLARVLGVEDGDFRQVIAGKLSWPAKYCAEVGRQGFWEWQPSDDEEGGRYRITKQNAAMISQILTDLWAAEDER